MSGKHESCISVTPQTVLTKNSTYLFHLHRRTYHSLAQLGQWLLWHCPEQCVLSQNFSNLPIWSILVMASFNEYGCRTDLSRDLLVDR